MKVKLTRDELLTPTAALSTAGTIALALHKLGVKHADTVCFITYILAAGGIAMAMAGEVQAHREPWRWDGIYRSLRKPNRSFWRPFLIHLPQLLIALAIAFSWRYKKS